MADLAAAGTVAPDLPIGLGASASRIGQSRALDGTASRGHYGKVRLPEGFGDREEQRSSRVRNAVLTFLGLLVLFVALGLVVVFLVVKGLPWITRALPGDAE